jgi:5'-3' exonuclease
MRETKDRDTGKTIFNYLNIDNLKKAILCEVKEKWNLEISYDSYEDIDIVETYCTMTSILGNDFIPHLLTVELKTDGIDKLVSATKKSIEQNGLLVNKGKINYDTLKSIFKFLAVSEDKDMHYICEKYINKKIIGEAKLPSDCYALKHKDNLTYYIYDNPDNWHKEYYKQIFDNNITLDSTVVFNACNNYIKGIYWVYSYYRGYDIDCEWFYPYNFPPTLKDLTNHSIACDEPIIEKNNNFVSPNIQLLIVLPKESSHLLKPNYKKYMEDIYHGLFHMYPVKYQIQTFLKTHLWECCPILPLININYIKKVIENN